MNNLLRTLTESRVKPTGDLKLLLTAVKETRRQSYDSKISDAFYDSLDNLLADLKTIAIDNRDAEAFLKPVSRAEVPDYYDYITSPMDFATMARKLKNKQYKSKREFTDDLELIWSNCYKYNAAEDHPLRQCADRLKAKAERLLKYVTDRKDRTDPQIPFDLASPQPGIARPKPNGMLNGTTITIPHRRSPSTTAAGALAPYQPIASTSRRKIGDLPFADTPALVRTAEGMVLFRDLDRGLSAEAPTRTALQKLKEIVPFTEPELSDEPDDLALALGGVTGDKRKLNGDAGKPRKRARFAALPDDLSQLWWSAVQTDALIANGLPEIPYASSESKRRKRRRRREVVEVEVGGKGKSMLGLMNNNIKAMRRVRQTHAKLAALVAATSAPDDPEGGEGGGIAAVSSTGGGGALMPPPPAPDEDEADDKIDERHWTDYVNGGGDTLEIGEESAQGCVRWVGEKILEHAGFQGASSSAMDMLTGVFSEYLLNVGRSIRFLTDKYSKTMTPEEIILHTLFESGVSKVQELDKYISDDIERHGVRLLELEKKLVGAYRESTAGQEALEDEGLFEEEEEEEAGALAIGDFADALGEDYLGLRELGIAAEFGLSTLSVPKSLLKRKKAQKLAVAKPAEKPLDYPLPPAIPLFTYSKVDDQIGLLKPFYQSRFELLAAARAPIPTPLQPPPPPAPSIPLANLPGPLQGPRLPGPTITAPYPPNPYPSSTTSAPPPPSMDATQPTPATGSATPPQEPPPAPAGPPPIPPNLVLPDDPVPYLQAKMGPLGQISKPNYMITSSKKRLKPTTEDGFGGGGSGPGYSGAGAGGGGGGSLGSATFIPTIVGPNGLPAQLGPDGSLKKKKASSNGSGISGNGSSSGGGGTMTGPGSGRKKKDPPAGLVLPVSATNSQASSNGNGGGYSAGPGQGQGPGSGYYPAVFATA